MKVFISHARSNALQARDVAQGLADQGFDVWFDEWEIQPGENWAKKLGRALETSDAMVAVLPSSGVEKGWQEGEIQYALVTPRFKDRLIPVMSRQVQNVPWILKTLNVVRPGRSGTETARRVVQALQRADEEQSS